MKALLRRFERNIAGSTAIEYVLLGSLVAIAIIVGAAALGTSMNATFEDANATYEAGIAGGGATAPE
ncbi:MAG: Flp family type IVb pilin [Bauldia sp.]